MMIQTLNASSTSLCSRSVARAAGHGPIRPISRLPIAPSTTPSLKLVFNSIRSKALSDEQSGQPYVEEPSINSGDSGPMDPDMWASKPVWCQPWTILATGTGIVSVVWAISSSPLFTGLASVPVLVWWYLFLVVVPQSYREAVLEHSRRL